MADFLTFVSAVIIVVSFLILGRFIIRLGIMEREAIFDYVNPPPREIPSQPMVGVKNPFMLKLKTKTADQTRTTRTGVIELLLSAMTPCYVTFYWEVNKAAIDAAICKDNKQQGSTFDDSQDDDSDSDLEEPSMSAIPLGHILQGSYKDRSASEFYDPGSNLNLLAVPPVDLECEPPNSDTVTTNSSKYELVVTVEMSRRDELGPQQLADIVGLIMAVKILRSPTGKLNSSIVIQCVQTAEGKIYSLKKLFVIESEDVTEPQTLSSHQSTSQVLSPLSSSSSPTEDVLNSPASSSDLINAVCIVCRELPVTRAFLPCRHACICGLCCRQLNYCPMCRGLIQSYFKVQDEPFVDDAESDASSELKEMSVGEILRGVFSAS